MTNNRGWEYKKSISDLVIKKFAKNFVFFSQCFWGLTSFFESFLKIVAKKFGGN
tara:strand:+ start:1587 stop:1748 length:162 start_codon:yes stop_codon:yes gene_type:complete